MSTQFVTKETNEIDRASFQAANENLSVLFLHLKDGRQNTYTAESPGGKMLATNKAPKIPFMQWVARTVGELTADFEPRDGS